MERIACEHGGGPRVAGPRDVAAYKELIALANVPVEQPIVEGILDGQAGSLLLAAAEGPDRSPLRTAAGKVHRPEEVLPLMVRVSLPLISRGKDDSVVGALQGIAPGLLASEMGRFGGSVSAFAQLFIKVAKISAIGVNPAAARTGVGTQLLREALRVYTAAGYELVYGYFRKSDSPFLGDFYERAGFEVTEKPQTCSVTVPGYGVIDVGAAEDEQCMFSHRPS